MLKMRKIFGIEEFTTSLLNKNSGIIPVVVAPNLKPEEETAPIIPFSPPPKTISKLLSAINLPTVFAFFMFVLLAPELEPLLIHIFFFKIFNFIFRKIFPHFAI